jgi:Ca-activated chloride channel homolog
MPSLSLEQPVLLVLLVLALPFTVVVARQRLRRASAPLRMLAIGLRVAIFSTLALALVQPALHLPSKARSVVFALDVSDSMQPDQQLWGRAWIQRAARTLPPGSHWRIVEFGERAQLVGSDGVSTSPPPGATTDLAAGLRLASSVLAADPGLAPEIVVLSDGWENAARPSTPGGGVAQLAPLGAAEALPPGLSISYVAPPRASAAPWAVVRSVEMPSTVRVGEAVQVPIDIQTADATQARMRIFLDGGPVADNVVQLQPGDNNATIERRFLSPGFHELRVEVLSSDSSARTSSLSAVTFAKDPGRVLVLEDEPQQADALVPLLTADGLQVDKRSANSLPPSASALTEFDAIVLVNTPATSLTLDQQRTLQSFVQDLGRGLVVVGGPRAFSPGGYEATILDDLLPLSAQPPVEPQQGSLALILVIDRSGSMDIVAGGVGSSSKMAMAREAAIDATELLQVNDTLGVIAFDSSFQWIVPPTKLRGPDDVKQAEARISQIRAGGGTSILPPLEAAYVEIARSDAPLKHIVLMTDGESNDRGYEELIARMKPAQVTLSTLAIGSDADTKLLNSLARLGGGRYYFTERANQIPKIASKEATILTRNAIVEGQVATLVSEPSPILRTLSGDFPVLTGYVATTRKDRATTALESEKGHPLLAHWQYGLGRVVAWASEAQRGWTADWANWAEAPRFWSQAVRWALPAPTRSDFQVFARMEPDGRHVDLSAQSLGPDGRFADLQDTRATVVGPDGTAREVVLPQRAPGTYELYTRVDQPGTYRVLFTQALDSKEEVAGFVVPDAPEAHTLGTNLALLDELSRRSGGHALRDPADLGNQRTQSTTSGGGPTLDLWPWLLGLALVLLPLDVYIRRRV